MTNGQRDRISNSMERYELYMSTNINVFTNIDIEHVKAVRKELGNDRPFCVTCLDEVVEYMKETYQTIWLK